jgi:hypothetical protein
MPGMQVEREKAEESEIRPDETGYPSHSPRHAQLLTNCFDTKTRPLAKLLHTSEKMKRRNLANQLKQDRMLERVTLDRSLLIREKIKCLNSDSEPRQREQPLSKLLKMNKMERQRHNRMQKIGYAKALHWMSSRLEHSRIDLQEGEIFLINLARVVIQGGWVINSNILQEILDITGIDQI